MSRIGRKPVALPSGVTAEITKTNVTVKGPKGSLSFAILPHLTVALGEGTVVVTRTSEEDQTKAAHGLTRQIIANMIQGVSQGFSKQLEIIGVGYRAQIQGKKLVLSLGFSHPVEYAIPEGIEIAQDEKNKNLLTIRGISKQLVGQVAADIRSFRPPEPYKGKGIRYTTEFVRRKPGKAAVGKTGTAAA